MGVEYFRNGTMRQARARREVILSAGTVGSAKILMLSGVGPKEHLRDLGVLSVFFYFLFVVSDNQAL